MNLQFKHATSKTVDDKLIYDVTIQDLDCEIADGQEIPFSYIFGQEPTSVLESYINDHIEELKSIVIPDSFESELNKPDSTEEVDEFSRFFNEAQIKINEFNQEKTDALYIGVDLFDDVFACTHENFNFISNVIDYYKTKISNKLIKREKVRQKIISTTNTVHILNFDQLLELNDAIFEKMNDIYLKTNYFKSIKLNDCETADEIIDLKIDFDKPIPEDHFIDDTVDSQN